MHIDNRRDDARAIVVHREDINRHHDESACCTRHNVVAVVGAIVVLISDVGSCRYYLVSSKVLLPWFLCLKKFVIIFE